MARILFITNIIIEIIIAVLAAVGNGAVLVVIGKFRHLQTVTNYLIASLAAADFLVGIWGIPCVLATNYGLPRNLYGCLLMNCIILILTNVSIFSLLSVAIERFVAVKSPFFYQAQFTHGVALTFIGMSWVLGIVVGLVPMIWNLGWNEANICAFILVIDLRYRVWFNFFGFIVLPLFAMFVIYVYIFEVVRRQIRQVADVQIPSVSRKVSGSPSRARSTTSKASILKKELRAAKKFGLVIGLFALSWIPLETMNAITLLSGKTCLECVFVAVWLSHLNSALNPLLYAYGNRNIRGALKSLLLCQQNQVAPDTSTFVSDQGL